MAKIDITKIQPTRLCKDLRGRFIEIFGIAKSGKTSTAVMWPKPLLCAFEKGYNALVGVYPADIDSWATFKDICRQLKNPEMRELYETIIIDTTGIAYSMCEDFVKAQFQVKDLSEVGWNKGHQKLREEFEKTFRELSKLGYAIVFIAHSKVKTTDVFDKDGNKLERICPNLTPACAEIVNGLVDVIAYLGVEYDENREASRYLYLRETPTIFAGSRYRYIEPKIPLGYDNLVNAVANAMEKEAKATGTQFVSEAELKSHPEEIKQRPFKEVMDEARQVWEEYLNKGQDDDEKEIRYNTMQGIISNIFGSTDFKISQASPQQADLVELFINEVKDIM